MLQETYDVEALCAAVGNLMFILGGLLLVAALGSFVGLTWVIGVVWVVFTLVTIGFAIYANTGNRFQK